MQALPIALILSEIRVSGSLDNITNHPAAATIPPTAHGQAQPGALSFDSRLASARGGWLLNLAGALNTLSGVYLHA
ncbi:hypothetical protein Ndes2526B_g03944 [Nannochloris sp. 'desiccata']|nr:hypothetical protein KSW81_006085 [Chlorella desiccata (nom. nud.)]KAH7621100.1 hypothetical protein NADE_009151 [Chlorella desiccata (nom. nud.)]